jgi:hypothetical protein
VSSRIDRGLQCVMVGATPLHVERLHALLQAWSKNTPSVGHNCGAPLVSKRHVPAETELAQAARENSGPESVELSRLGGGRRHILFAQ